MLPFLTDLLKHDFEMYSKDSDNYSYYEPLNWIAYEKADVPGVGVKQSMAFLFRVIIFISVKFSTIQSVRNKETWREAVIDFL